MKDKIILILLLNACFWVACNREDSPDLLKSTGEKTTSERSLSGFHSIMLLDDIEVELRYGTTFKAVLTGGKNLLPKIDLAIKDSVLSISNKNTMNWVRSYKKNDIKLVLYFPRLKMITQEGAGKIYSSDTLRGDYIDVEMKSSGDMTLMVNCFRFSCEQKSRNYGNMVVSGKSTQLINVNYGVGSFNSYDLNCTYGRVEALSKSTSYVYLKDSALLNIADEGDIYLKGNPNEVKFIAKTGKGNLILVN